MSGLSMGGHESPKPITTTWLTPPEIIDALGVFDLDPCAYPGWATANRLICLQHGGNGLTEDWSGRVWLNPPYDDTWTWLSKLADHSQGTALIFARTETRGFVQQVWERADALLFLHGRLKFFRPDGTRAPRNAGAPSVLVAYGPTDAKMLRNCGLAGSFVTLRGELEGGAA